MPTHDTNIAFIGFGEAAQAFAAGFRRDGVRVAAMAFDIKHDGPQADMLAAACADLSVAAQPSTSAACEGAAAIFWMVTADQAEQAATAVARTPMKGAFYLDCNSCAPETKRRSALRIDAAGGRYVDVAVMTPVHPRLHQSPCLLAGPWAEPAGAFAGSLGMTVALAGDRVGDASTRKMVRSVMIKGLEALTLECFLAARAAGIEGDILTSLEASFPGFDWARRAPYMVERAVTHGTRRAAEMREVAQTLEDLGITPHATRANVARQADVGALGLDAAGIGPQDLAALLDAIRGAARGQI